MGDGYTFSCGHELADHNINNKLPKGWVRNLKNVSIVNSNGIANDPSGKLHPFGGEIFTSSTDTAFGQASLLQELTKLIPGVRVNYRSGLHVHVGVPGLREDLRRLKRLAQFNDYWLPKVLPVLAPIPEPRRDDYETEAAYQGAWRIVSRRKRMHQFLLAPYRTGAQLRALTLEKFFLGEVSLDKNDKPLWHIQPCAAVNVRQLLETDTIEFRNFPGTLDWRELAAVMQWCNIYTTAAMAEWDRPEQAGNLVFIAGKMAPKMPKFATYDHVLETRYRATHYCGRMLSKKQIKENIAAIEAGTFDDASQEAWFEKR